VTKNVVVEFFTSTKKVSYVIYKIKSHSSIEIIGSDCAFHLLNQYLLWFGKIGPITLSLAALR
jgi:hypothetical protein